MQTGFEVLYSLAVIWLLLYGFNKYYITYLFLRNLGREAEKDTCFLEEFWKKTPESSLPRVTTQLPVYNEKYVAERLLEAVVGLDYPKGLHEIQVLDDSTDETRDILARAVEKYHKAGYNIKHITRANRHGFKAGALEEGLHQAEGEFIAIFDADFLPEKHFLKKTVPFFYEDRRIAFVQTRWTYMNRNYSLLTQVQGIALDSQFVIEQGAKCWNGLYMSFNGTAGVWRKEAIIDADGWHVDTLAEDLDLSYRAQLKGWRPKFLYGIATPSELPVDVNAFKTQQYRWAKGATQTARKLLPSVFRAEGNLIKKLEALFHLTNFTVYPFLLIIAFLSLPLSSAVHLPPSQSAMSILAIAGLASGVLGPSILFFVSQKIAYNDWKWHCIYIPATLVIYAGIALNNSLAVIEGLFTKGGEFMRTPKYGIKDCGEVSKKRGYVVLPTNLAICEMLLGLYCLFGFLEYLWNNPRFHFGPFLLVYALGFFCVGGMAWVYHWKEDVTA